MRQLSKGVWSVVLTSFNDDNSIDLDGLKSIIDFYIENGCDGLFATCASSEVLFLSQEEIITLCRETVKHVNGRAQVVGGAIYHGPLQEQAKLIKQIIDTGVDVPVITTNQICKQGDSSQIWMDNFQRLLDMTDGPLGIYEAPYPFKRLLSSEEMKLVCDSGRVVFHKDTCCDRLQIKEKLKLAQDSVLSLYNANVDTLVDSLNDGARGYCGTATNFYPDVIKYICDNYDNSDFITAAADFMIRGEDAFKNTYPLAGKHFLQQRGVDIKLNCRVNVRQFTANDQGLLVQLFSDMQTVLELCNNQKMETTL